MVESLANGHIDGFCVGAPWNLVAVESGVGRILHLGCEIMARVSEKVLAVREGWANDNPAILAALIRALAYASDMVEDIEHRTAVVDTIAKRIEVSPALVARALAGNIKLAQGGATRSNNCHIIIGRGGTSRPDPVQAAWLYAQLVRWGQAPLSDALRAKAQGVFRPDLFDDALGNALASHRDEPRDRIGAFVGPDFAADDIGSHLSAWSIKRSGMPRLSVVR
jgi:NitT/TauT family transport system ATP-binding protein